MTGKSIRRCLAAALVVMSAAVLLTGCGGSGADSNTIKIGGNFELSGNNASYGSSAKNGMEMAVKEINDNGGLLGKKLEIVTADNRSEATEAANAMQKLLDSDVKFIIGPDTSSGSLACVSTADKEKVPMITPYGTNPDITVDPTSKQVHPLLR